MSDDLWSPCPRCGASRERHIDRKTGRYTVTLAAACDDKERCERELMAGFEFESDTCGKTAENPGFQTQVIDPTIRGRPFTRERS
jgi:hypothetical protein